MTNSTEMTFEQAMKRLEEIVQLLEAQDISLEESVALYKEGAECSKFCKQKLETAHHEIEIWQEEAALSASEAE